MQGIETVHRQDSSPTRIWRQFIHRIEDSSPTHFILFFFFLMNVNFFTIIWDTIKQAYEVALRFLLVTPVIDLIYVTGHTHA